MKFRILLDCISCKRNEITTVDFPLEHISEKYKTIYIGCTGCHRVVDVVVSKYPYGGILEPIALAVKDDMSVYVRKLPA